MSQVAWWTLVVYFGAGALLQGYFSPLGACIGAFFLFVSAFVVSLKYDLEVRPPMVFLILFMLGYATLIPFSTDPEQAILEAIKFSCILPILVLTGRLSSNQLRTLYGSWVWIGAGLVIIGLMGGLFRNYRLESTLQYANVLAIFLLASILLGSLLYDINRSRWMLLLMAFNTAGLWLTLSRSVWVLWLIAVILLPIVFAELRKLKYLIHIALVHIAGFVGAAAVRGDLLFITNRAQTITANASEFRIRLVYWKDSLALIKAYPFGTGGGGWSILQNQVQTQPYYVKYIHNHYIQIILDTGWVGLILFLLAVGMIFLLVFSNKGKQQLVDALWNKATGFVGLFLLLHAGFDFDFSFPFLFAAWLCLAAYAWNSSKSFRLIKGLKTRSVVLVLFGIMAVFSCSLAMGYSQLERGKILAGKGDFTSSLQAFSKSSILLPWASSIHYERAKALVLLGNQTRDTAAYHQAREELEQAIQMVPEQSLYKEMETNISFSK